MEKGLKKFENPCAANERQQHGESGRCVAVTKAANNSPSSEGRVGRDRWREEKDSDSSMYESETPILSQS